MRKLFWLVLAVSGCVQTSGQSTGIQAISCPTDSTLTYVNFGQTFMQDNCMQCHDGRDSPNMSTLAKVQVNSSRILDAAVYSDAMPANGGMTTAEREMLGEWLACGAP